MKIQFIIVPFALLFIALAPNVSWAGGDAGNGGGVSEQYFVHAYLHLGDYIQICLDSDVCRLTPREQEMLVKILGSLPKEYKTKNQVQFLTGSRYKKFFTIDGLVRVAVTGNKVGDPIYVYDNELYSASGKPITLGFAIGKLVHEFGHHHGVKDTPNDWLDRLGEKVELGYERRALQDQTYLSNGKPITATYFASGAGFRELIVSNKDKAFDLTDDLVGEVSLLCRYRHPVERTHLFAPSPKFDVTNMRWRNRLAKSTDAYYWIAEIHSEIRSGAQPLTVTVHAECPTYPGYQGQRWEITFWISPKLNINDVMAGHLDNLPFSLFYGVKGNIPVTSDLPRE